MAAALAACLAGRLPCRPPALPTRPAARPAPRGQGPLGGVLDSAQLLYDVSGAGNNWAHGHHGYGPQYRDALADRLYRCAEEADSLQAFMLLHSLGGGTGSGLGTYILDMLEVCVCVGGGLGGLGKGQV
jgi:hypothetical protein